MRHGLRSMFVFVVIGFASSARAHFNMLMPEVASAKRGEAVTLLYQWGHPFEHQLFDAPAPEKVSVRLPDGQTMDLSRRLEKVTVVTADAKATAYRLRFTPEQRGDYVFVLGSPPIWMPEDQVFLQDTVKVVLHVQAQKGWDAAADIPFQITPLTRPYGLQPGMTFQVEIDLRPLPRRVREAVDPLVEIEHYNRMPPKPLPPDEHITRTVKMDPNGVVTCTLTDPGWWCITAQRDGGKREHEGKAYPVRQRATLWVHVDEKVTPSSAK